MAQRPYDILTAFPEMIVQYDLERMKVNVYLIGGNTVRRIESLQHATMIQACLSAPQIAELDFAASERREVKIKSSSGALFVTAKHDPHFLEDILRLSQDSNI